MSFSALSPLDFLIEIGNLLLLRYPAGTTTKTTIAAPAIIPLTMKKRRPTQPMRSPRSRPLLRPPTTLQLLSLNKRRKRKSRPQRKAAAEAIPSGKQL